MVQMIHSHATHKLPSICRLYTGMRVVFLQAPTALQVFKLQCHEYECLRQVGLLFPRLHSSALLRKAVARKTTTFELLKCTGVLHRSPLPVSKLIAQQLVYANWGLCWYDLSEM